MSRCPTCGQPTREALGSATIAHLERLRAQYPGFTFSDRRDESGHIVSHYCKQHPSAVPQPMIGNKTVAHVRQMLAAMTEGSRPA